MDKCWVNVSKLNNWMCDLLQETAYLKWITFMQNTSIINTWKHIIM